LIILRAVLLLCALTAFIIVILFLDDTKGEDAKEKLTDSVFTKVLLEIQDYCIELLNIVRKKRYVLFCFPLVIGNGIVQAFTVGSFPKVFMHV